MNHWHWILRAPFHGEVFVDFFKKKVPSLTTLIFTTQIRYWLRWLRCFAKLHIKVNSLVATLITLIYTENSFITEFADYLVFNSRWEITSSLTNLLRWYDNMKNNSITDYANCAYFEYQIRNSFITEYADFRNYIKHNFKSDSADFKDCIS